MRRVEEVIDAWYDSGAMPFAQFHYPFEGEELFERALPGRLHLRGDRPDPRLVLLAARRVDAALRPAPATATASASGLILDPEGQKMSKSRGNVVDPWEVIDRHGADAFRWYYLTAQQPWAGYRFSVETVGESVRQFLLTLWNTYSFWVLYANAEGLGPGESWTSARSRAAPSDLDRWALSRLQGTIADRDRAHGRLRLHHRRAGRSPTTSRSSPTGTCASPGAASGRATAAALRDPAPLPARGRDAARPVHARSSPTRSTRNLAGGAAEEFGELPDSVHLRDFPEPDARARRRRARGRRWRRSRRDGRARPRRPRPGQGQGPPAAAPGGDRRHRRRARGDRAPRRPRHRPSSTSRSSSSSPSEAELVSYAVKPNYRALGPRFGKQMPQVAAAVEALDAGHVAEAIGGGRRGRDQRRRPRPRARARRRDPGRCSRSTATRSRPRPATRSRWRSSSTTSCAARGWRARSSTRSRTRASDAGLEVTDRIALTLGGDAELLDAARAHEAYVAGETLATAVVLRRRRRPTATTEIDGRELRIAVERAGLGGPLIPLAAVIFDLDGVLIDSERSGRGARGADTESAAAGTRARRRR